jgi:hypothetical protein
MTLDQCVVSSKVKLMKEYLDVENILLEENEDLLVEFGLFEED